MPSTFAIVKTNHLAELGSHRPSGCAVLIYTALLSFSRNKTFCFPSIATLSKQIGGKFSTRSIQRGLLFLEQIGFIKRNDKRSKQRFVMLKQVAESVGRKCLTTLQRQKRPHNRKKENYSFYKSRKTKSQFSSQQLRNQMAENHSNNSKFHTEEQIWSNFVYHHGGKDLSKLSQSDICTMGAFLRNPHEEAVEWREIMWAEFSAQFLEIKETTNPVVASPS